ncbi:hypothetical protein Ancab_012016 [Ancistrocladus abbreviatus]
MDVHNFAQEILKPPSENGPVALEHPLPLSKTHEPQDDGPSSHEWPCPPYKRSRNGETNPNLGATGFRNKETTNFIQSIQDCRKFKTLGKCSYGDNCKFFHGLSDARRLLHDGHDSFGDEKVSGNGNLYERMYNGIRRCRKFQSREECPYGERCIFLHEGLGKPKAIMSWKKTDMISIPTSTHENSSSNDELLSSKEAALKTRLCKKWGHHGNCPYGRNCFFAHGQAELRKIRSSAAPASENMGIITEKTVAEDRLLCKTGTANTFDPQAVKKKYPLKLERLGKVIGIYADWIEEKHQADTA